MEPTPKHPDTNNLSTHQETRPIETLKNLGPKSANWLKEIGIETEQDLRARDIIDIYLELKALHPQKITLMMLWALQGALLDMNCLYLPSEIKQQLKSELAERF